MKASTGATDAMIYIARMNITSATEVKYLKGVGPQRAAVFASRGIHSVGDLLLYLPFRYEDRIRFNKISEIAPGGTYTIHGTVCDAGAGALHPRPRSHFSSAGSRFDRDVSLQVLSRRLSRKGASVSIKKSWCTAKRISIRAVRAESK